MLVVDALGPERRGRREAASSTYEGGDGDRISLLVMVGKRARARRRVMVSAVERPPRRAGRNSSAAGKGTGASGVSDSASARSRSSRPRAFARDVEVVLPGAGAGAARAPGRRRGVPERRVEIILGSRVGRRRVDGCKIVEDGAGLLRATACQRRRPRYRASLGRPWRLGPRQT